MNSGEWNRVPNLVRVPCAIYAGEDLY